MKIEQLTCKVVGLTPLLMHNPAGMARSGAFKEKRIPTPEDEARVSVYVDADGHFVIPMAHFRGALLRAASGKKSGKRSVISIFSGTIMGGDEAVILCDPKTWKPLKEYSIDSRTVVIQRQRVLRSRPRFEKWACEVVFEYDAERLDPTAIRPILEEAGIFQGVGDFRPGTKGWFGKFEVLKD